jgi:hypothetical protein
MCLSSTKAACAHFLSPIMEQPRSHILHSMVARTGDALLGAEGNAYTLAAKLSYLIISAPRQALTSSLTVSFMYLK